MADSSYRPLHAVDYRATEHSDPSISAEASQSPTYDARTRSPEFQDDAERHYRGSHSSEPRPQINSSADEGHSSRRRNAPRQTTPLLTDPEISYPSASVETRLDESENGLRRPTLEQSGQHSPPAWMDFYFRPLFIVSLSILLILSIAALEVLHFVSQRNQGLVTASENMHYAWTYGPTFVLTMIAAIWGQLEQRAKQIMPWCVMSRGEVPAQKSLMLNYLTSSMPGSLLRSLKRRHFLVSIGIFGSLILRLTIIFSSGLLRLEYRSLAFERDLNVEDIIEPRKTINYKPWQELSPVSNVLNYWAVLKYGLPYPHGTTSQFAVQSFGTGDEEMYDKLTGEIQVFESSLENCEPFEFTISTYAPTFDPYLDTMSLATPASLQQKLWSWCYASYFNGDTNSVSDGIIQNFLNLTELIYKCTNSTSVERQSHRILFTLEHWLSYNESEVSGFTCEPKYSLTRRSVTNTTQSIAVQDRLSINGETTAILDMGIRPFNMTEKIFTSLGGGGYILDVEWNTWYTMLNLTQPQENLWSFRNTSLVIDLSQRMWKGIAAHVVKRDYTIPSNETIKGTVMLTQSRLCVQELALRLIEGHIALLLALIVALCFLRPGVFYRDPASLGAHAIIMARSPGLMDFLQGHGVSSKKVLRASLSSYMASFPQDHSSENPAIGLHQFRQSPEDMAEKPVTDNSDPRKWWSPMSERWWFRICLMATVLAVLIILEVLLQLSDRETGLGDVSLDGYLKYTWTFLPTLVLVLVGLLFSMVDSTARTLHPFQLMRNGRATLKDIFRDPARQVSLMAVAYAAWKRHFVLLLAALPALLAPILTIIASGLYTVAPVPSIYDTELKLTEWLRPENRTVDFSNDVESHSEEEWAIFTLTQFSNLSYPQWTHEEYTFASFEADGSFNHDGNDTSFYITARVPATRADLNCSLIGHYANDTYPTAQSSDSGPRWLPVDPRPLGCHTPPAWNRTAGQRDLYLSSYTLKNVDGSKNTSRGYYLTLLEDDYDTFVLERSNYTLEPTTTIRVCGDGRQHYFVGLGYGTESLSLLHCVPYVEALWVNATFSLADLSLVADLPVTPDEDSAVFLSDSASVTAFMSRRWEEFVEAMVNGSSGVGAQLTGLPPGPDNNDTRHLISAVESTLANYFAQVLHFNYRQPLRNNESASALSPGQTLLLADGHPITSTVTDHTRLRLIQNTVSTRILQGLLAVMGACLVASTALGRGARVIPRDPGSVASRMAYFAGGEVWRRVPVGADRWTDGQIRRHGLGVSEGRLLLGWWGGDDRESGSEEGARGKKFAVDVVGCKKAE